MSFKNKGVEKLDTDGLDELEDFSYLEDLEDFGFDDMSDRKPSVSDDAREFVKGGMEGIGKGIGESAVGNILPDSFSSDWSELEDRKDFLKDLIVDNYREVKNSVGRLLPEEWQNRLSIEKETAYKTLSEDQLREQKISEDGESIFESFKSREALRKEAEYERGELEKEEFDRISDYNLSYKQIGLMTDVLNSVSRGTNFMIDVGGGFFRKSLELKQRIHFTLMDTLRSQRSFFTGFAGQLAAIQKNTALPEYAKINASERLGEKLKGEFSEKIYQTAWSNNDYVESIKNRLGDAVREKTSSILDFSDQVEQMVDLTKDGGMSRDMFASIAGSETGRFAGRKTGDMFFKKHKDKFSENELVKTFAGTVRNLSNFLPTMVTNLENKNSELLDSAWDNDGISGIIGRSVFGAMETAFDLTRQSSRALNSKPTDFSVFDKPAIFDQNAHRNITEGIPFILSGILKNVGELNRNYAFVNRDDLVELETALEGREWSAPVPEEELYYNFQDRKLSTKDEYRESIDKVVGEKSGRTSAINRVVGRTFREANTVLEKAGIGEATYAKRRLNKTGGQNALTDYLTKMSRFPDIGKDWESLIVDPRDLDNLDPRISKEIIRNPALREVLTSLNDLKGVNLGQNQERYMRENFDEMYSSSASGYPLNEVKDLFKNVSVMATGEPRNTLTDTQAEIIAETLASHIDGTGQALPSKQSMVKAIFQKRLTSETAPVVEDVLVTFLNDLGVIEDSGVRSKATGVTSLMGEVSNSISEKVLKGYGGNEDSDADLFRKMGELNPVLREEGKFDFRNVMKKTTRIQPELKRASDDELDFLKLDVEESNRRTKNIYDSKLAASFDSFGTDIKNVMINQAETWTNRLTDASKVIKKKSKSVYESSLSELDRRLSQISVMSATVSEKTVKAVVRALISTIGRIITDLERLKFQLDRDHEDSLELLRELRRKAEDLSGKELEAINDAELEVNRLHEINVEYMEFHIDKLHSLLEDLERYERNYTGEEVLEFVRNVRSKVRQTVEVLKAKIKSYKG